MKRRTAMIAMATTVPIMTTHAASLDAPNVVVISDKLVTSGQPNVRALTSLVNLGFEAVIYLAPTSVSDSVKNEPEILASTGIAFAHIPVPFDAPAESHFLAFSEALDRFKEKKTLAHCQINLRASSLVFLYRTVQKMEDPMKAFESVSAVWSPNETWRRFIKDQLNKHHIKFETL